MRRPPRLLIAVPAVALLGVTACAPFHAGAAATVGSARISTDQLRSLTEAVVARQPAGGSTNVAQPAVQQGTLSELVQLRVLASMAGRAGITVTPTEIGTARTVLIGEILQSVFQGRVPATLTPTAQEARASSTAAAIGIDLDDLAQVQAYVTALTAAQPVATDALAAAFARTPDHRYYAVDAVAVADQTTAAQVAGALKADPRSFAQIAASLGAGAVTRTDVPAAALEQEAGAGRLKAGAVVGPGQTASGTYEVILVTGSGTRTLTDALANGSAERTGVQSQLFTPAYTAEAKRLGVHVNPRFGAWTTSGQNALGESLGMVAVGGSQLSTTLVKPATTPAAAPAASPAPGP